VYYAGEYFKNSNGELEQKCFDPSVWKSFTSTSGKLRQMLSICQNDDHQCVKNATQALYTEEDTPSFADLVPQTTNALYYWYSQFQGVAHVEGLNRCASSLTTAPTTTSSCEDDIANIFARLPGEPTAVMRAASDSVASCPTGVDTNSTACRSFLGLPTEFVPVEGPSYWDRKEVALEATVPEVSIQHECIPDAVKIADVCLVE